MPVTEQDIERKYERIRQLRLQIATLRGAAMQIAQMRTGVSNAERQQDVVQSGQAEGQGILQAGAQAPPSTTAIPTQQVPGQPTMQAQPGPAGPTLQPQPQPEPPGKIQQIINELITPEPIGEASLSMLAPRAPKSVADVALLATPMGALSLFGPFGKNLAKTPYDIANQMLSAIGTGIKGAAEAVQVPGVEKQRTPQQAETIRAGAQSISEFVPGYGDIKDVADVAQATKQTKGKYLLEHPGTPVALAMGLLPGVPGPNPNVNPDVNVDVNAKPPAPPKPPTPLEGMKTPEFNTEGVGISRAAVSERRGKMGAEINRVLEQFEPAKRQAVAETLGKAADAGLDRDAPTIAREVVETRRPLSSEEEAGLLLRVAQTSQDYEARIAEAADLAGRGMEAQAADARKRADLALDELDLLDKATIAAGTELGRGLQFRQTMLRKEDLSLAKVKQRAQATKGEKLTPKEDAVLQRRWDEYEGARQRYEERLKEREELVAKREKEIAEKVHAYEQRRAAAQRRTGERGERITKERASIKDRLKELGFRVNDITGVSAEGLYLVGRLAASYIHEGVNTLDEVVAKVRADLPELSDRDVWKAINARDPKVQRRVKSEAEARVASLKKQARLLDEMEAAKNEIFAVPPSDVKTQQRDFVSAMKEKGRTESAELREQQRIEKESLRLSERAQRQYESGQQASTRAEQGLEARARIERLRAAQAEARAAKAGKQQAQRSLDRVVAKKIRDGINELHKLAYLNAPDPKALERSVETLNNLRNQVAEGMRPVKRQRRPIDEQVQTIRSSIDNLRKQMHVEDQIADLDEQLRTGEFKRSEVKEAKPVPPEIERAQVEMLQKRRAVRNAMADLEPYTPRKVFREVVNTARTLKATADLSYTLRQGLFLSARRPVVAAKSFGRALTTLTSDFNAVKIDNEIRSAPHAWIREKAGLYLAPLDGAQYSAREEHFMSRVAEKIPVWKEVVKASERHMVTGLNLLRSAAFDQFLDSFPNATDVELKAWADFVNVASGRGNLGRLGAVGDVLGTVFFAPRFAVSRVQTPYKVAQYWRLPRVRKEIAKDLAATYGLGITALSLAALAGAEVEDDPDSPDFGKIKIDNTRIDIWAGQQQPMRLIARTVKAAGKRVLTGKTDFDPLDAFYRFSAFKLGPGITTPRELLTGKTAVGEKVTPDETLIRLITPLMLDDIYDAYKSGGVGRAVTSGTLTGLGVGVNTYKSKSKRLPPGYYTPSGRSRR